MVFLQYLQINVFVWARVVCGTRYYQSASVGCSQTIQKIHVRKIEWNQGPSAWCTYGRFHDQRTFNKGKWKPRRPGVCADAQCCKITWLEELASESNTIQAQEDISVSGKIAGTYQVKLYMGLMVIHQDLWIAQFVWADVLCGTRYYQSASVDCSGVIQKIHMREI